MGIMVYSLLWGNAGFISSTVLKGFGIGFEGVEFCGTRVWISIRVSGSGGLGFRVL